MRPYKVAFEHPTQLLASTFLRALAENDGALVWERLSRESRGLLEGRYAAAASIALHRAASVEADRGDARLAEVVAPVRVSALGVLGGPEQLLSMGVSAARLVDRAVAYVLLLPDFGEERIVEEAEWRPAHLLAFVHESREWLVDLGRTADLSADAELPDPLGLIR
ncbi:MAG: hypothetical protein QOH08_355 [Chloroflexota bacterium]|jgi:hypothetical protein|nr:hypothetical protein [Chloroflexota bacterium]